MSILPNLKIKVADRSKKAPRNFPPRTVRCAPVAVRRLNPPTRQQKSFPLLSVSTGTLHTNLCDSSSIFCVTVAGGSVAFFGRSSERTKRRRGHGSTIGGLIERFSRLFGKIQLGQGLHEERHSICFRARRDTVSLQTVVCIFVWGIHHENLCTQYRSFGRKQDVFEQFFYPHFFKLPSLLRLFFGSILLCLFIYRIGHRRPLRCITHVRPDRTRVSGQVQIRPLFPQSAASRS